MVTEPRMVRDATGLRRPVVARPMWWRRMVESGGPVQVCIVQIESWTEKGMTVLVGDPTGRRHTVKRIVIERISDA